MSERDSRGLTKKRRFWLDHLEAWAKSDQSLAAYATAHDLNRQHLYNWRTRLRGLGLLSGSAAKLSARGLPNPRRRRPDPGRSEKMPVRFAEVRVIEGAGPGPSLRIRFPNGITFETVGPSFSPSNRDLITYLAGLP